MAFYRQELGVNTQVLVVNFKNCKNDFSLITLVFTAMRNAWFSKTTRLMGQDGSFCWKKSTQTFDRKTTNKILQLKVWRKIKKFYRTLLTNTLIFSSTRFNIQVYFLLDTIHNAAYNFVSLMSHALFTETKK
jgi:hypothetical protein